jgi:hypothetical protein
MSPAPAQLHLLVLGKTLADHRIHRRLDKGRGDPLAGPVSLAIVDRAGLIVGDIDLELSHSRIATKRIKGLLSAQGITGYEPPRRDWRQRPEVLQTPDGRALPPQLKAVIIRESERMALVVRQISEIEAARNELLRPEQDTVVSQVFPLNETLHSALRRSASA